MKTIICDIDWTIANLQYTQVKKKIYHNHLYTKDIFCVFNDRLWVVTMRRSLWLFVFDVN